MRHHQASTRALECLTPRLDVSYLGFRPAAVRGGSRGPEVASVALQAEQRRCGDPRPMGVIALTATGRDGGERLTITDADRRDPVVRSRLEAKKGIAFVPIPDEMETADAVA